MEALYAGGRTLEPIVLIGFMGSGKSTLGRRLADHLGCSFIDLDRRVEEESGRTIRDLIERDGEVMFRQLELEALRRLVAARPDRCVVATGGGVVESDEALPLLRALGRVVWLRADPRACVDRIAPARAQRPLLDDEGVWQRRWKRREPLYRAAAQHVVDTHPDAESESFAALVNVLGGGCR